MTARAYGWLMAGGGGDAFDRHLFACVVAVTQADAARPLAVGLGLSAEAMAALVGGYFPHAPGLLAGLDPEEDGAKPLTSDEFALRGLLMGNRSFGTVEEEWLAHIIARRALSAHPLWQDMGLGHRDDLSLLMARHFRPLAERNRPDMRWKPFFWREIERAEGFDCRAEMRCAACRLFARCFGPETGTSRVVQSA
jgi:nitrogen fixation protein NifQ